MTRKTPVRVELSELYHRVWESCVVLWPIFLIRVGFLFINFFLIILCLFIGFWPLVLALKAHLDESSFSISGFHSRDFFENFNWMTYFSNWNSLALMALVAALYITLVSFFLAFFDGALYSQMNRHQKNGETFSLKRFFEDGIRYTLPMMGLQWAWLLVFFGLLIGASMLGVLVVFFFKALWFLGILLAIPLGLLLFVFLMMLLTAAMLAGAFLVDGHGVWDSVGESLTLVWKKKGRTLGAILLISFGAFVFYIAFNVVFTGLSFIPLIGFLFSLVKVVVDSILSIGFSIYIASLSVALQQEAKEAR